MNRIRLAALLAVVLSLLAPLPAAAQAPARVHRIALPGNDPTPPWEGLRQELREPGYVGCLPSATSASSQESEARI